MQYCVDAIPEAIGGRVGNEPVSFCTYGSGESVDGSQGVTEKSEGPMRL